MIHNTAVTIANDIDQSAALGRRDSVFNFLIWDSGKVIIFQSLILTLATTNGMLSPPFLPYMDQGK